MALFDSLFGIKPSSNAKTKQLEAFEINREASTEIVELGSHGGIQSYSFDSSSVPQDEVELIKTYRSMAINPKIELFLNEIKNEIFIFDVPTKKAFELNFVDRDKKSIPESIKKKITEEFHNIYNILEFDRKGIEYFTSWYVDGRLFLHKVIDTKKPSDGIKKIIPINPLAMKRVKEVAKKNAKGIYDASKNNVFYIYNPVPSVNNTFGNHYTTALKISEESITYVDSGIYYENKVIGNLYKAIVPFNNLKMMEESLLIYRVSRAPERRVIYVDVGNLPKNKAEQYMKDLMERFRNKLTYDSKTGSIKDKSNVLSMMEDFWLPRRNGQSGTEISTLPGGENLGITDDVEWFSDELGKALNVPASRFEATSGFSFGKTGEISRDEYRFKKFIDRLRSRFIFMFEDILKTQLLLKNIITEDDWDDIKNQMYWVYAEDNLFVEEKEQANALNKAEVLAALNPYIGKYYSREWVRKNVLMISDEAAEEIKKQIAAELEEDMKAQAMMAPPESDQSQLPPEETDQSQQPQE